MMHCAEIGILIRIATSRGPNLGAEKVGDFAGTTNENPIRLFC